MKFTPRHRDEIAQENESRKADNAKKYAPWPQGDYDFVIASAVEKVSQSSGNEMIALDLVVYDAHGQEKQIKDYISITQPEKLCSLCDAVGLGSLYDKGDVHDYDLNGCSGRLGLTVKVEKYNGENRPKNNVRYYIPRALDSKPSAAPVQSTGGGRSPPRNKAIDLDDDIPFTFCAH